MLWYKAWLETRLRLVLGVAWAAMLLFFDRLKSSAAPVAQPHNDPVTGLGLEIGSLVIVMCCWFAGAGMVTQGSFQFLRGLEESSLFTLSLPVSRLRILSVRALLGWFEMALTVGLFCGGVALLAPALTDRAAPAVMLQYIATLLVCSTAIYSFSVALGTVLDDQWRTWGTMLVAAVAWGLPHVIQVPASLDLFRAMGPGSPLLLRAMPWGPMAVALGWSAVAFFAAVTLAQRREF